MSASSASSMPHPTAAPFTAAMTGTSVCSRASAAGVSRGVRASRSDVASPAATITCFTSSPEQKAGSVPVITRHRAVVSRTASSSAPYSSKVKALRASGRSRVRISTSP